MMDDSAAKVKGKQPGSFRRWIQSTLLVCAVPAAMLAVSIWMFGGHSGPVAPPRPAPTARAPEPDLDAGAGPISSAVSRLVEELRRQPPPPSMAADRVAGLYLIEIKTGLVTLIADEPDPGVTFCGSPSWSTDGKRIIFDAMRPEQVALAHIKVIEVADGNLKLTDLGVGNCPSLSPSGDQIAFLLNYGGVPGAEGGVWVMQADGAQRRRLGSWGRPMWSPDGRQLMIVDFQLPAHAQFTDVSAANSIPLKLDGVELYSVPYWTSPGTIVAVVGSHFGDTIALIDVNDPAQGKVTEVLWEMTAKGNGIGRNPHSPVYLASTGRCVFVGGGRDLMSLYTFVRGQADSPRRLEPEGSESLLQDIALSPDGRFALFTSNRAGPRQRGSTPAAP